MDENILFSPLLSGNNVILSPNINNSRTLKSNNNHNFVQQYNQLVQIQHITLNKYWKDQRQVQQLLIQNLSKLIELTPPSFFQQELLLTQLSTITNTEN